MDSNLRKPARRRTLVTAIVVGWLCGSTVAGADEGRPPFLRLGEERGHLTFTTCLPPGKTDFSAIDEHGLHVRGFVLVTGEEESKRVRLFRLQAKRLAADPRDTIDPNLLPTEFSIVMQATPSPDHYSIHLQTKRTVAGREVLEEARLGRHCCGYYVMVSAGDVSSPAGRAPLLTHVMVEAADTYGQFERLAEVCNRPGFEFVPASSFSPSIVSEVVAADQARPGAETIARFRQLVADLDSDEFARRDAASRELLRGGRSTLWSLDRHGDTPLSAEQRQRLRQVRADLAQFDTPRFPFEFAPEGLRELVEAPPSQWLSQLQSSSDPKVSDWARHKMPLLGAAEVRDHAHDDERQRPE